MGACRYVLNVDVRRDVKRGVGIRFCGKPTRPGASYCPEHHRRCHRSVTPALNARFIEHLAHGQAEDGDLFQAA